MTATIQKKKDRPNYYVLIRYRDEKTGKERQKWETTDIPVKGNNIRKAEKRKDEILAQYMKDKVDIGKDSLFTDFIKDWLETRCKTGKIQQTTYDAYTMTLNSHILPFFEPLRLTLKDIEPRHIQKYVNCKMESVSVNTIKKHMANLVACLDSAVKQNIIPFNPAKRIEELKKVKYTGAMFLSENEIEQMLTCFKGDPLEIVILITLFYGLRRSETIGIKWGAIDFTKNTLAINHTVVKVANKTHRKDLTKNASSNDVLPLPDLIKSHLSKWKEEQARRKKLQPNNYVESEYICTMFNGELMKTDYVSKHFKLIMAKNGLPSVRFHDLRHSSATYLKYLGFDLKDIQSWLRHADLKTTSMYTHMDMTAKTVISEKLNLKMVKMGL